MNGQAAGDTRALLRTKPLDHILQDAEKPEYQLKRALGPIQLILFGIGAIIGAGIFATIGTAATGDTQRPGAGPALMISFVITAIVCAFTAFCYAEFASMVPISGSAYTYSYATLGELVAWIIGWDLIIEYAVGNIAVAISWAGYFKTLLESIHLPGLAPDGMHIPDWLSMDYRTAMLTEQVPGQPGIFDKAPHVFGVPIVFNLPAVAIVVLITVILVWGVRESARFNAIMVGIKIIVLTFFVIVGLGFYQAKNWHPFMPNGWAGISAGAAIIFFAYIGFDAVSTVAEETREPQRNLPIGILGSLVVCTVFYVVVAAVFSGMISYEELQTKSPKELAEALTMALKHVAPNAAWTVAFVGFGSVIAHTAVLLVYQLGQPRIFFSMARDGLLPRAFARVHPRFRTPHVATILTGVFVAAFAAFASIDEMVDLTNIGTLFAFILVCAGIIVLRLKDPDRPRPFRVPSGWAWAVVLYVGWAAFILLLPIPPLMKAGILAVSAAFFALFRNHIFPVLGIVSCLYLVYYLPPTSWLRFAAWLNFGFVVYVGYGSVHSGLTGRKESANVADHDARTAYQGVWLALAGAALLFLMRGFDAWLVATKSNEALSGAGGARAALAQVFSRGPWLEVSWFLIVPLALNAFILSPIVIRRAMRARREGASARHAGNLRWSVAAASALSLLSVAYFFLVYLNDRARFSCKGVEG